MGRLPSCELYELSYMHRDEITHHAMTPTDYYITASKDGFVKFWKKNDSGIEFVKVFKTHLGMPVLVLVTPFRLPEFTFACTFYN